MTYRIWLGSNLYLLRKGESEAAVMKHISRRQRSKVTKVELVLASSEWRAKT